MLGKDLLRKLRPRRLAAGFTLAEVAIAMGVVAMVMGGMILAYTQAARRAQWTGFSLAAQSLAIQQLEQARSAIWDPADYFGATYGKNEITNFGTFANWHKSLDTSTSSTYEQWTGYTNTILNLPVPDPITSMQPIFSP